MNFKTLAVLLIASLMIAQPALAQFQYGAGYYGGAAPCPYGYGAAKGSSDDDDELSELKRDLKEYKKDERELRKDVDEVSKRKEDKSDIVAGLLDSEMWGTFKQHIDGDMTCNICSPPPPPSDPGAPQAPVPAPAPPPPAADPGGTLSAAATVDHFIPTAATGAEVKQGGEVRGLAPPPTETAAPAPAPPPTSSAAPVLDPANHPAAVEKTNSDCPPHWRFSTAPKDEIKKGARCVGQCCAAALDRSFGSRMPASVGEAVPTQLTTQPDLLVAQPGAVVSQPVPAPVRPTYSSGGQVMTSQVQPTGNGKWDFNPSGGGGGSSGYGGATCYNSDKDSLYAKPAFQKVCSGKGTVNASLICHNAHYYQDGNYLPENASKCESAITSYMSLAKRYKDLEKQHDKLQAQLDKTKGDIDDLKLEKRLARKDEDDDDDMEASPCKTCDAHSRSRKKSSSGSIAPLVVGGVAGLVAELMGQSSYNSARKDATALGWTYPPYQAGGYAYPFVMGGLQAYGQQQMYGAIAGGTNGAFGCAATVGGMNGFNPNGQGGPFGMSGPFGSSGPFGNPYAQGFPGGQGGGMFMPGMGPWGASGAYGNPYGGAGAGGIMGGYAGYPGGYGGYPGGMAGGMVGGIAGGFPGGYMGSIPGGYAGGYMGMANVGGFPGGYAGGIAGGFAGGISGGFPGGYMGGMMGGIAGGFPGGYMGGGGIAGGFPGGYMGGMSGGFPGGYMGGMAGGTYIGAGYMGTGGFPGGMGGGLTGYNQQMMQMQMQQYQMQMEFQQNQQENAMAKYQAQQGLMSEYYSLMYRFNQLSSGLGGLGVSSGLGLGVSSGLGVGSPLGVGIDLGIGSGPTSTSSDPTRTR